MAACNQCGFDVNAFVAGMVGFLLATRQATAADLREALTTVLYNEEFWRKAPAFASTLEQAMPELCAQVEIETHRWSSSKGKDS